jgi:hypothetical protein
VIAVWDWLVPAVLAVNMTVVMHCRGGGVAGWVGVVVDGHDVLVVVVVVGVVKVPVVQVVRVPVVHDSGVSAIGAVNVVMPVVDAVVKLAHGPTVRSAGRPPSSAIAQQWGLVEQLSAGGAELLEDGRAGRIGGEHGDAVAVLKGQGDGEMAL